MEHRVFISHSSKDAKIAQAICHYLEQDQIRCWIAPRDICGTDWAGSILQGITGSDVFVVVLSGNSIISPEVLKEVTEATRVCQYILPFKVDQELLSDRLRYHLAACHWLDAVNPPLEARILELVQRIHHLSDADAVYQNNDRQRLVGTPVTPKSFFMGREQELAQIHSSLEEFPVLFLQGMGGIGKSEIAKGYARAYGSCYDTVLFANYRGSILEMVTGGDIEIENLQRNLSFGADAEPVDAYYKRKLDALRKLSNPRTLLIVDNYDTEYDEYLEDLAAGPFRLLVTTRFQQLDYPCMNVGSIQDFDTVRRLFMKNYGKPLPPQEQPVVDQLLQLVQCHTITTELIAKQMRASFIPPQRMLQILRSGGMNAGLKETVRRGSTGKSSFDFIKALFRLSDLSSKECDILKAMCMVPFSGIDAELFGQFQELEDFNAVNTLLTKSWLMEDEQTWKLKLHPVIYDVVTDQLKPGPLECSTYVKNMSKHMCGAWWMKVSERQEKWPLAEHILQRYPEPVEGLLSQYVDLSNAAWVCGQFSQAISSAKACYGFILRTQGDVGRVPAASARSVAGAFYNSGDAAGAREYYFKALEHILKKPEESYTELGFAYQKTGRCAYQSGDYALAQTHLNASLDAFAQAVRMGESHTPVTNVDTYVELARMYMAQGAYDEAIGYARKSYDLFYAWKGCEVTSSAYPLHILGTCYSNLGEYEKAEHYLQRALELNLQFNGQASMITAQTRETIAENLARQGRTPEARRALIQLQLDVEKHFGVQCPYSLRIQHRIDALT